jgi:DNA polymerase-3 subunit delta
LTTGILILEVRSWPANTRLYKAVAATGLAIDCKAPARPAGWLVGWARDAHGAEMTPDAAEMLVDMVGSELGLLDQEVAKLVLVAEAGRISPETVAENAGSWRVKTAWQMLDAALDGKTAEALVELDRLLSAGEHPIAILAQVSASLRRLAAATRLVLDAEQAGRRMPLRQALQEAGVRPFALEKAERQLRRLGRHRGASLYRWLLQADLDLKGASAQPPRLVLERLVVQLAAPEPAGEPR